MARSSRIFTFILVTHRGYRIFFHEESGRATAVLEAEKLPAFSTVTLHREGREICRAVRTYGPNWSRSHCVGIFCGPPPLVEPTAAMKLRIESLELCPPPTVDPITLDLPADFHKLHLGDRLRINLGPKETRYVAPANWSTTQWLQNCTRANRDAAVHLIAKP